MSSSSSSSPSDTLNETAREIRRLNNKKDFVRRRAAKEVALKLRKAVKETAGAHNIVRYFERVDVEKGGRVTFEQFKIALRNVVFLSESELEALWESTKKNSRNTVRYLTFLEQAVGTKEARALHTVRVLVFVFFFIVGSVYISSFS